MPDYHEPHNLLSEKVLNAARALNSFKEEIEAVNWYNQRADVCSDEQLKKVLLHNRDEEIEHASMALEWLRRNMPSWDRILRMYLFTTGDLTLIEEESKEKSEEQTIQRGLQKEVGSLGIGKLE